MIGWITLLILGIGSLTPEAVDSKASKLIALVAEFSKAVLVEGKPE